MRAFSQFSQLKAGVRNYNVHFYPAGLYRADATFSLGEYKVMTAFNGAGTADAVQLQAEFIQLTQRIEQLKQLIGNCPKGSAGKACREPYQKKLKEIQVKNRYPSKRFYSKTSYEINSKSHINYSYPF